ncbi:hypothetical protein CR513_21900, partial [Mucuna pruriens]
MDRNMIDAASNGSLMDKTPAAVRHLISNMASNTQQFRTKGAITSRVVNVVNTIDNLRLENQLSKLTLLVRQLVVGQHQPSAPIRVCGICSSMEHLMICAPRRTTNQHSESATVGYFQKSSLSNDSKFKRGHERVSLRSGRELPQQPAPQPKSRLVNAKFEPEADSLARVVPLPFPTQTIPARKSKIDENLLKMFQRVEINILVLDAIKQISKYAKFLKELFMHKRKKMKGGIEMGGVVLALIKNEEVTTKSQQALPKKIFSVPCTIGDCTFVDAMLDLGASINVMPSSIYNSLNFGDLEPTRMIIQLANKIQVNELIFPTNFYVLDMEDKTFGKGSTLILG